MKFHTSVTVGLDGPEIFYETIDAPCTVKEHNIMFKKIVEQAHEYAKTNKVMVYIHLKTL